MSKSAKPVSRAAELQAKLRERRKGSPVEGRGTASPGKGQHTTTKPVVFEARPHKAKV